MSSIPLYHDKIRLYPNTSFPGYPSCNCYTRQRRYYPSLRSHHTIPANRAYRHKLYCQQISVHSLRPQKPARSTHKKSFSFFKFFPKYTSSSKPPTDPAKKLSQSCISTNPPKTPTKPSSITQPFAFLIRQYPSSLQRMTDHSRRSLIHSGD